MKIAHQHSPIEFVFCPTCGKKCRKTEIKTHILRHENFKKLLCSLCDKRFTQKVHLKQHMIFHSGARPFKCSICKKAFAVKSRANKHERKHQESYVPVQYKCENCSKMFKYPVQKDHKMICQHLDYSNNQICCKICQEKLKPNFIPAHFMQNHLSNIDTLKCDFCDRRFIQISNRATHIKNVHDNMKRRFTCKICPSDFSEKGYLESHYDKMHKASPFQCQTCEAGFLLESELREHSEFHDADKPFECESCKWRFPNEKELNQHKRRRHKDRVSCTKCVKNFHTNTSLKRHEKEQHQENILFKCTKCPYETKRHKSLEIHESKMHI